MKNITLAGMAVLTTSTAFGGGLYNVGEETESSLPIQWSVGMDAGYDDNTTPGGVTDGDETFSIAPFVGISYASNTPQTTMALYSRLGLIYYFDEPAGTTDDTFGQSRLGFDLSHRFDERLRFTSRSFVSYELEPDYSQGVSTNRQSGEAFFFSTDNSIGYRWSERFATYTGIIFSGLAFDSTVTNQDRDTWTAYNQFRYQMAPQTVITSSYRYNQTMGSDLAADSTNHFFLVGFEQRVSSSTIIVLETGVQMREVEAIGISDSTDPYLEFSMRTQVNADWGFRAFVRYGTEDYDTIVNVPALAQYGSKLTLRTGVSGEYKISPKLAAFGGVNLITSSFENGRFTAVPNGVAPDEDEVVVNAFIGSSLTIVDNVFATLTYNFTTADSDIVGRDYDRNRITVGVRSEF